MPGVIAILSTGSGHDEVTLKSDPIEAKKQVDDLMQKRYTLFVNIDGTDCKVSRFDETTNEVVALGEAEKRVPAATAKMTAVAPVGGG
jgi:hypothetical protein